MRLLILGIDMNRNDLLKYFIPLKDKAFCYFLENFSPEEVRTSVASDIGEIIYWRDFRDAIELLEQVKPDKVVYALIDNYYHFALLFASRERNIPVVYVDHGIRFEEESRQIVGMYNRKNFRIDLHKTYPKAILAYYKHSFFRKTLKKIRSKGKTILKKLFIDRTIMEYNTFMIKHGHQLQPDEFIIYSEETWKYHKFKFGFKNNKPRIHLTGIPPLDEFVLLDQISYDQKPLGLLFIDQPLHEQNLLGWTKEGKISFIQTLSGIVAARGYTLFIKPHPWNEEIYEEAMLACPEFELLRQLDLDFIEKNIRVVVGINSTLLLGFCALQNYLTICISDHPVIFTPNLSRGIVKYQVAVEILKINELDEILSNSEKYLKEKLAHLENFHSEMMFSFDGMSGQRMINFLLAETL